MYMIKFTRKDDDTKMWVPYFDVLAIAEKGRNTIVRIKNRDSGGSDDFYIQEEAQQILDQMKQPPNE